MSKSRNSMSQKPLERSLHFNETVSQDTMLNCYQELKPLPPQIIRFVRIKWSCKHLKYLMRILIKGIVCTTDKCLSNGIPLSYSEFDKKGNRRSSKCKLCTSKAKKQSYRKKKRKFEMVKKSRQFNRVLNIDEDKIETVYLSCNTFDAKSVFKEFIDMTEEYK